MRRGHFTKIHLSFLAATVAGPSIGAAGSCESVPPLRGTMKSIFSLASVIAAASIGCNATSTYAAEDRLAGARRIADAIRDEQRPECCVPGLCPRDES